MLDLEFTLFADETTIFYSDNDLNTLIERFRSKLDSFSDWVKFNQLTINWNKTKIMILSKKKHQERL